MHPAEFFDRFHVWMICDPPEERAAGAPSIAHDAHLHDAILRLDEEPGLRVVEDGKTVGTLTRGSCDKLPFRCWVFGMISHVEMQLRSRYLVGEFWREQVSAERIQRARDVKDERVRRGQLVNTRDCLQFGDIAKVGMQHRSLFNWLDFRSKRRARDAFKKIEVLRNEIAHSQPITEADWPMLCAVAAGYSKLFRPGGGEA